MSTLSVLAAYGYIYGPSITGSLTAGRAEKEPATGDKVVVEVYSWSGAPWGHASINIDGTIYNQGGGEFGGSVVSGQRLWGEGWFTRTNENDWYGRLSGDKYAQTLQRYSISLTPAEKKQVKEHLDGEFEKADSKGSPNPQTVRKRGYHFLWGNCATTTSTALPWWVGAAMPVAGHISPPHFASSLDVLSLLPNSQVKRLRDKNL